MALQKLTKRLIDSVNPDPGERVYLWDTEVQGLGLRCIGGGKKTFLLKFEKRGRQTWIAIGKYGHDFTLDQAREEARKRRGEVAQGVDLAQVREAHKKNPTVSQFAADFLETEGPSLKERTLHEYKRQIDKIILPAIGKLRVNAVTYSDIAGLLHGLRKTRTLYMRVLALLRHLFNLAELQGKRDRQTNPCFGQQTMTLESRERFLSDEELKSLGETLDALDQHRAEDPVVTNAIRFLLFSGWRLNEALQLKWSQVDLEAEIIRLPDSKGGKAEIDVNPAMALVLERMKIHKAEMEELRRKKEQGAKVRKHLAAENPYVFPGREEESHLVNLRKPWLRICEKAKIEGVRLHDLRRTFGTIGASDAGLTHETIGKVLRHRQTSTTAIYARLASPVRKQASQKIGEALRQKLSGKGA